MTEHRTPEDILFVTLRDIQTRPSASHAGYSRQADTIIRALGEAGFEIIDTLSFGNGYQAGTPLFTRDQVAAALNDAANMLSEHDYESSETIAADDTVNLVVNTAMYLVDHPGGSLDDAIAAQYADSFGAGDLEDELDDGEAVPEPGTERWNQLIVAKVKGVGVVSWQAPEPYYHDYEIQVQGSRYRYDKARGAYVYDDNIPGHPESGTRRRRSTPEPDPELELYTEVTGRRVYASYTHAAWRDEYAATGQTIAMERMLALVTETTHCDALDGPATPGPVRHIRRRASSGLPVLAFIVAVALTAVLMVIL